MQTNLRIVNVKKMRRKSIIAALLMISSFLLLSCDSKYSKKNHLNTLKIDDHLFYEIFQITSGGTLASDTYSYYITDSLKFRKYVGTIYYDDEHLHYKLLDSNHVLIFRSKKNKMNKNIDKKTYDLTYLKEAGKFD